MPNFPMNPKSSNQSVSQSTNQSIRALMQVDRPQRGSVNEYIKFGKSSVSAPAGAMLSNNDQNEIWQRRAYRRYELACQMSPWSMELCVGLYMGANKLHNF